jgi:hypothetical protein
MLAKIKKTFSSQALIWSANSHLFNLLPDELGLHLEQEQRVGDGKGNKRGWD